MLPPISVWVALVLSCAVTAAMCTVPLFGIQGTESALLLGVLQPPLCAYAAASLTRRYRLQGTGSLVGVFEYTLGFAFTLWFLPVLGLWLDSYRIRSCNPIEGFVCMLLGPGFGIVLAAVIGTGLGLFFRRRRAAPLVATAIPLLTAARAIWGFYSGPSIYAYGHFFGFFPGTVYDESVSFTQSFLWLRVGTGVWILGATLAVVACTDPRTLTLSPIAREGRGLLYVLALSCLGLGCLSELRSEDLGWSSSTARVRTALGASASSHRCHLYFPREWSHADRQRLSEDCDFRVEQAERWLELKHPQPIDVYLFRSPAEKYALMGAEETNLAKPWRSEVYISTTGWPNPVLGHELVHVVARAAASGPLAIAGRWGGLWPNPALIEGVAMAAAFQPLGGITLHEWAHAMLELGMIPPLTKLFGPGFLGHQERLAYTLSGSLLSFVHQRWGAKAVQATYRTGSLAQGVGVPIEQIDEAWRESLRAQPLAPNSRDLARARFGGGGVLSALCPHVLAKLRDNLRTDVAAGDDGNAEITCERILAIDSRDTSTRAALAALLSRQGDDRGAQAQLGRLVHDDAPAPHVAAARQAIADQALRDGHYQVALSSYELLLREPIDDDQRRALQVKSLACSAAVSDEPEGLRQAQLLFELLVGAQGQRADPATAVYLAQELGHLRTDGLGPYLEGRQLYFQARYHYAAELFATARERGLPTLELSTEALRTEAISRIAARSDLDRATVLFTTLQETGTAAQRAEATDYLARIDFVERSDAP